MTTNRRQQKQTRLTTGDTGAVTHDSGRVTVPVIVWRTAPDTSDAPRRDSGLSARLAEHLVEIYTTPGDTIADFDADTNLRDATEAAGRSYVDITNDGDLSPLLPAPVALVVMRWPRPNSTIPDHAQALLTACQRSLDGEGSVIIAITSQPTTTYAEHEHQLLTAASAAGLQHLHDIIPLTADDGRDTFHYPATEHNLQTTERDSGTDTPCHHQPTALIIFGQGVTRP